MAASGEEDKSGFEPHQSRTKFISSPDNIQPEWSPATLRRFHNPFSAAASAFGAMFKPSDRTFLPIDQPLLGYYPHPESQPVGFISEDANFSSPSHVSQSETAMVYNTIEIAGGQEAERNRGYLQLMQGLPQSASDGNPAAQAEETKTTPLFSNHVQKILRHGIRGLVAPCPTPFPQYGLLGLRVETYNTCLPDATGNLSPDDNLIFANMNAPWSAFICGSQGAGKSHSLSCLLENSLLASSPAGENPKPLAGLVFHYDKFTSSESTQLCEAAYLCSSGIPVRVLVSPSNVHAMHKLYRNLPGLPTDAPRPEVIPLFFQEDQLNVTRLMTLMAVDDKDKVPLYMEVLFKVLRDMTTEKKGAGGFDYVDFKARLSGKGFNSAQNGMLRLRLEVLESFLAHKVQPAESAARLRDMFKSAQGTLTIVDLSCPFVNENDACALFTICLSVFMENRCDCGRIIALDEAHKFLTRSGEAEKLTDELTSIVRQQRHLASRIIVSTQEPTLAPRLIDLCNVSIVHRFSSPAWFEMLQDHLAGASRHKNFNHAKLFETIVGLPTGEALIFCPAALFDVCDGNLHALKDAFIRARIRNRVTADGGKSILASDEMQTDGRTEILTQELIRPFAAPAVVPGRQPGKKLGKPERRAVKEGRVTKSQAVLTQSNNLRNGLTYAQAQGWGPEGLTVSTARPTYTSVQGPTQDPAPGFVQDPMQTSAQGPVPGPKPPTDLGLVFATDPFLPLDTPFDFSTPSSRDTIRSHLCNTVSEFLQKKPRGISFPDVRKEAAYCAGLPEGFFADVQWKNWSRRVINEEVVDYCHTHRIPMPLRG